MAMPSPIHLTLCLLLGAAVGLALGICDVRTPDRTRGWKAVGLVLGWTIIFAWVGGAWAFARPGTVMVYVTLLAAYFGWAMVKDKYERSRTPSP